MTRRPEPIFRGDVTTDGGLVLADYEREQRRQHLRTLVGKRVDVIVREHRDTRSLQANAYYWSCVLEPMSQSASAGDQSPEDIHDAMCAMFLPDERKRAEFFNFMTGKRIDVEVDTRRSSKLTGGPFYDFVEQVRKFALEFMGVRTEDPDPQYWRKRDRKSEAA